MAVERDAIRMTEVEVAPFLLGQVNVQVACLDRDGGPHLTTLSYVTEGERIAFWTYPRQAQKRIAVLVHPESVATWDHRKLPTRW